MKNLFSTLIFILLVGFSFGQASVKSASDLTSIKEKGVGYITLPSNLTKADVASRAKYYPLYFTVDFNESTKVATIKMVENDERSRAIIVRFLAGCEIQTINVAGETISRDQLFEKYLK
jgi:hypothetical protein